ncbi:MAG: ChbG/HpnK family deacetylase [Planctomycetes bacterium]|nr:ChbG/HpnK family deacetylase [Planctomycetota bacterium]
MSRVKPSRLLLVIADDIGIGPNTTAGILQLGAQGIVTGSVLLVNSPYAAEAIRKWRQQGCVPEIGWHPELTLDAPIASPTQIPSLVRPDGTFWPLKQFLQCWLIGRFNPIEIEYELRQQLQRFIDLVGYPPAFLNWHQHIGLFSPIGEILLKILSELPTKPYIRRVQEPWDVVRRLPGSRLKRACLGWLGRRLSRIQEAHGFPGNDWLAGISAPSDVENPEFFANWLRRMPGDVVELMCHPGRLDPTVVGRDCTETDGMLQQRVNELRWLRDPAFIEAAADAGFRLAAPSELIHVKSTLRQAA